MDGKRTLSVSYLCEAIMLSHNQRLTQMNATVATSTNNLSSRMFSAIVAGIAGGVVFGMMMSMMGTITMIAKMAGSESEVIGWLIHLMISSIFGIGYAFILSKRATSTKSALLMAMVYGLITWVIGPLVMMPAMMGMTSMMFQIGEMQMMSLMGHIIYAIVTALVFLKISK